jgi:hypothetical protein
LNGTASSGVGLGVSADPRSRTVIVADVFQQRPHILLDSLTNLLPVLAKSAVFERCSHRSN